MRGSPNPNDTACIEVRSGLVDYMEGDLDPASATRLLSHLEVCPGCTAVLDGMRNVVSLLGHLAEFDLPPRLRLQRLDSLGNRLKRFEG